MTCTYFDSAVNDKYIKKCVRYLHFKCVRISYGVATVSRIDKVIGLFWRTSSLL